MILKTLNSLMAIMSLAACSSAEAATTVIADLPYRGRFDSPFYPGIQNGTTYVEDFEDMAVNTPGLTMSTGKTFFSTGISVDEDDGILDHLGNGRSWVVPNAAVLPEGPPFSVRAEFAPDAFGNYPTHAGMAILGYTTLNVGSLRYFQAFDADGNEILSSTLSALTPVLPNTTPGNSNLGDRFFGLIHEGGISRIVMGGGVYFDHVQYGYGPIPEPGAACLSAAALAAFGLRRRRNRR